MQDIYPGSFYAGDTADYIAAENRILGLARLRQVRVRGDSCVVPEDFRQEIKFCYADWATSTEDTKTFGKYKNIKSENETNVNDTA